MKKHIYALAALASLAAGAACAQATDPRFTGEQPGISHPEANVPYYGNSGWTPEQAYGSNGNIYPYALGQALGTVVLPDGRRIAVPQYGQYSQYGQYPRTSRDRDGDGVANWNDRYPDDPRYR